MKQSIKEKILKVVKKLLNYEETKTDKPILINETKYQPYLVKVQYMHHPQHPADVEREYMLQQLMEGLMTQDLIEFSNEKAEFIGKGVTKRTATLRVLKK